MKPDYTSEQVDLYGDHACDLAKDIDEFGICGECGRIWDREQLELAYRIATNQPSKYDDHELETKQD